MFVKWISVAAVTIRARDTRHYNNIPRPRYIRVTCELYLCILLYILYTPYVPYQYHYTILYLYNIILPIPTRIINYISFYIIYITFRNPIKVFGNNNEIKIILWRRWFHTNEDFWKSAQIPVLYIRVYNIISVGATCNNTTVLNYEGYNFYFIFIFSRYKPIFRMVNLPLPIYSEVYRVIVYFVHKHDERFSHRIVYSGFLNFSTAQQYIVSPAFSIYLGNWLVSNFTILI